MDSLRGNFGSSGSVDTDDIYDSGEEETVRQEPPPEIGQDERRMQVRAYNHWAGLLKDRNFPSIEDLEPDNLPDFGPYSVLLDFTGGINDPAVPYLGTELARECDADAELSALSDVPSRSLLSRITDHYMQILANQAPIGFEAEFVNQRGATILYRGILLPYSSDDDTIDFIFGVINWKEMADQFTTDELLLEIDQALEADEDTPIQRADQAMADWADGPGASFDGASFDGAAFDDKEDTGGSVSEISYAFGSVLDDDILGEDAEDDRFPEPSFGSLTTPSAKPQKDVIDLRALSAVSDSDSEPEVQADSWAANNDEASEEQAVPAIPVAPGAEPATFDEASADDADGDENIEVSDAHESEDSEKVAFGLYDCLAAARESAHAARSCEDRSRTALYEAVGRAYDVSLAAADEPEEFDQLMTDNGLTVQDRAPMTPVVKLVFGADYDKTRLTEYAAVLGHAHRMEVERGTLAGFLRQAEGGLKGIVTAERRLRREESGKSVDPIDAPRESLAKKLRKIQPQPFGAISAEGSEFGLVMIRRMPDGTVAVIGEIADDIPLVERAARKLIG